MYFYEFRFFIIVLVTAVQQERGPRKPKGNRIANISNLKLNNRNFELEKSAFSLVPKSSHKSSIHFH